MTEYTSINPQSKRDTPQITINTGSSNFGATNQDNKRVPTASKLNNDSGIADFRQKSKSSSQLVARSNLKVSDQNSFQANYEEFITKSPQPPPTMITPQANAAIQQQQQQLQQQNSFRRIASRNLSGDPFIQDKSVQQLNLLDVNYNTNEKKRTGTALANNEYKGNGNENKQQSGFNMFKQEGKMSKLIFSEDDNYSFFIKGSIIDEHKNLPRHSKDAVPKKPILKDKNKLQDFLNPRPRERSIVRKKDSGTILLNNDKGMDGISSPNPVDNTSASDKKQTDSSDFFNSDYILNAPLIRQSTRTRSSILIPANVAKAAQAQKRNSISGLSKAQLEKFEKRDYMRRTSDVNDIFKIIQSQNKMPQVVVDIFNEIKSAIYLIFTLRIIKTTRPSSYSCISNSTHLFYLLFLNMNLIGLLIFLYPIIQGILDQQSLYDGILYGFKTSSHYSGHCFLALFIFSVFRISQQIKDFSLSKIERQSFKLVFTELKWNIKAPQGKVMTEKSKMIDQILENIDDNDSDKLLYQVISIIIAQIFLSLVNLIVLYFILDDSKLLDLITDSLGSSLPFVERLIIAGTVSLLLLSNNFLIRLFFMNLQPVAFTFYEKAELFLLYFNQMFILAIYQIKILGYISSYFKIHFITYTLHDFSHLSFLNYALAFTEVVIYIIESSITFINSIKSHAHPSLKKKFKSNSQVFPFQNNQQCIIEDIDNKQYQNQGYQSLAISRIENNKEQQIPGGPLITALPSSNTNKVVNSNFPAGGNLNGTNELFPISTKSPDNRDFKGKEENVSQLIGDLRRSQTKEKSFQDDESKFYDANHSSEGSGKIAKTAFRHMRKCIFLFSFNFLLLNQSLLSPASFILGIIANGLYSLHFSYEQKIVKRHFSYLDFNQFNSQTSVISLSSLLLSAFFNCVVGFQFQPTDNNSKKNSLFELEFEYIFSQTTVNQIIRIITLPYLLYPIIIFLSILLVQSSRQHQKIYTALNETYSDLRRSASSVKQGEKDTKKENEKK